MASRAWPRASGARGVPLVQTTRTASPPPIISAAVPHPRQVLRVSRRVPGSTLPRHKQHDRPLHIACLGVFGLQRREILKDLLAKARRQPVRPSQRDRFITELGHLQIAGRDLRGIRRRYITCTNFSGSIRGSLRDAARRWSRTAPARGREMGSPGESADAGLHRIGRATPGLGAAAAAASIHVKGFTS